jgi:hypothetical protein
MGKLATAAETRKALGWTESAAGVLERLSLPPCEGKSSLRCLPVWQEARVDYYWHVDPMEALRRE